MAFRGVLHLPPCGVSVSNFNNCSRMEIGLLAFGSGHNLSDLLRSPCRAASLGSTSCAFLHRVQYIPTLTSIGRHISTLCGSSLVTELPPAAGARTISRKRVSRRFPSETRAVASPAELETGFEKMISGTARKYYMLGGKGGVGKTSLAASLAVRFANSGHSTLVVSTDPAHSLSDSFAQDLTGGMPVLVEGPDSPLFAMEINPEQARAEFRAATSTDGGSGVKDFMDSMGLGGWVEQLGELKLGELLDTPPPGLDEAIAIAKVVQFMEAPEYSKFTRIVFDTAPTGHTLRLLSLPDFLDASIGKLLKLKQKLSSATAAIKAVFGQSSDGGETAVDKLELLKQRMVMVREIFRNKESTEFVIVTIPTVMAISESGRLRQSLLKEAVPVKRLIINQILPPSSSDCKFCNIKRKDQQRAIEMIKDNPDLRDLQLIQAPLFDVEIRGVPALKFMGDLVWR